MSLLSTSKANSSFSFLTQLKELSRVVLPSLLTCIVCFGWFFSFALAPCYLLVCHVCCPFSRSFLRKRSLRTTNSAKIAANQMVLSSKRCSDTTFMFTLICIACNNQLEKSAPAARAKQVHW